MMTRPLLFPGLLLLSVLAACSSNAAQEAASTATPGVAATPNYTPTLTPTPASTPTSTTTPTPTLPPTATLPPISLTFKPVADSYVDGSRARTDFGTSNALRVDASPVVNSYLRFTVQGLGLRPISHVRLLIYAYSASFKGIDVKAVADNTWGEKTITASNAPALGNTLDTSQAVATRTWVTFDVTSYITGEGTYSFGLSTTGKTAISLASRESVVNSPRLIVDLH
jgi:hypothetical protein